MNCSRCVHDIAPSDPIEIVGGVTLHDLPICFNNLNAELSSWKAASVNNAAMVSSLQQSVGDARNSEAVAIAAKKDLESQLGQVNALKSALASATGQIGTLQTMLTAAKATLDAKVKELASVQTNLLDASKARDDLQKQLDNMKAVKP